MASPPVIAPGSIPADSDSWLRRLRTATSILAWRIGSVAFVILLLLVYFRWLPQWIDLRLSQAQAAGTNGGSNVSYTAAVWAVAMLGMICLASWCAIAVIVLWKRSRDRFGILLFIGFASIGVMNSLDVTAFMRMHERNHAEPLAFLAVAIANTLSILWLFVFPDGRFVPKWGAWVAAAWVAWSTARFVLYLADGFPVWVQKDVVVVTFVVLSVCTLLARYLADSSEIQRDQLKWLLLCALVALLMWLVLQTAKKFSLFETGSGFLLSVVSQALFSIIMAAVPVFMFIAIFRQGLLDVDRWISRTLFYSALTAVVVAVFLLLNAVLARFLRGFYGQGSDLALVLLALPMAMAFLVVRSKLSNLLDTALSERRILTVMFIDIVDSTALAVQVGDQRWAEVLERFRAVVRKNLESFGGDEVDTAGDGFFATFVGPSAAIHCASAIIDEVHSLGLSVRSGIHTGEVNRSAGSVVGVAVHVGARIMALAAPGELLVSEAVRDLVAGSRIQMSRTGQHKLKGLPGTFQIYVVGG